MTTRILVLLLATLAVSGVLAARAAFQDNAPAAAGQVGQSFRVPYLLTDTNHYLVRVRINGKGPFNFLVDSGAPALFIGTEVAKTIGLEPAQDDFWTPVDRLDLEGGATLTGIRARIEDPFQLIGMNALGLPGASIDGILGFTILARFRLEFDPTDDRMTWTRIDFEPKEPFIPKVARNAKGATKPAEIRAMEMLGPVMKGLAMFTGKQPETERLPQGFLGIALDDAEGAARVAWVLEGSPAAEAGIQAGDLLERLRDQPIDAVADAHAAIAEIRPGDDVPLRLKRDGETLTLTLTAGEGL